MLAFSAGVVAADSFVMQPSLVANSCAAQCRAAHSQCRVKTQGSPSCDRQLQACMQRCLRR